MIENRLLKKHFNKKKERPYLLQKKKKRDLSQSFFLAQVRSYNHRYLIKLIFKIKCRLCIYQINCLNYVVGPR